ncbi:MAG: hypothetical protein AB2L09_11470 [Coriobacteriia bacterium]
MIAETKSTSSVKPPAEPITIEDLKQEAEHIGDLASSVSRRVAQRVAEQTATRKMIMVGAGVVVTAIVAFLLGRRSRDE